ncbi:type II toxin-antitoxin system HicA family toxin [Hankyongella ginsenosidimutans]|uniref:Type II toxin-antitoxin system HicA family toxin n=1 Tax=Hankyongella ginsenosidimutans TaxID=1763828 RepID=A0A4D7C914_9SPHN|nr:type II toxin-antitoxin system HicA family toxin [Hankyongella ginsenosidimutans]
MAQPHKTLEKLLAGTKTLRFAEFEALLDACGFELKRTRGSHRIYTHPRADRPLRA